MPISKPTVAALHQYRARLAEQRLALGPSWHDEGLAFDRGDGQQCSHATIRQQFGCALVRACLPTITFHGLRHTCATLLLKAGIHPKIVQERLGRGSSA